jgi:hypothetical protein
MRRPRTWMIGLLATTPLTLLLVDRVCFQGSGFPPPHQRVPGLFAPARPVMPGTVAIIVNPGFTSAKNHPRYWNNTSLVFTALKARGFERLVVLQSDGRSREPDRQARSFLGMFGTGTILDSPLDVDADGRSDVSGPGTLEALGSALRDVGRTLPPGGGRLLLFLTGHGQLRLGGHLHSVAMMWDAGELRGSDLDRLLRAALPENCWVAIVATQCHSKRFLDEVTRPQTLLVASGWPLWMWSTQDYGVFPYHLAGALLGRDPATGHVLPEGAAVNLRDAVAAARARDHAPEWPRVRVVGDAASIPSPF